MDASGRRRDSVDRHPPSNPKVPENVIKSGYLIKLGGVRKNWKKRFFRLSVKELAYYTSDDSKAKFKGGFNLSLVSSVRPVPAADLNGKPHGMIVETEGRTYKFQADSDEARDFWVLAINAAMQTAKVAKGSKGESAAGSSSTLQPTAKASTTASQIDDNDANDSDASYCAESIYVNSEVSEEPKEALAALVKAHLASNGEQYFFVRATYSFMAKDEEEISFDKDDLLEIIDASHDEWWLARKPDGTEGHIPSNRVQAESNGEVYAPVLAQRTGNGIAIAAFEPENAGELKLAEGDEVLLLEQIDADWFRGSLARDSSGAVGTFPVSFIEVKSSIPEDTYIKVVTNDNNDSTGAVPSFPAIGTCIQDFEAEQEDEISLTVGDKVEVTGQVDAEWLEGRLEGAADTDTKIFPIAFISFDENPEFVKDAPTVPGLCICIQPFESEHEDELTLAIGDEIEYLERVDADWLLGKLKGADDSADGIFPAAFVEIKSQPQYEQTKGSAGETKDTVPSVAELEGDTHAEAASETENGDGPDQTMTGSAQPEVAPETESSNEPNQATKESAPPEVTPETERSGDRSQVTKEGAQVEVSVTESPDTLTEEVSAAQEETTQAENVATSEGTSTLKEDTPVDTTVQPAE